VLVLRARIEELTQSYPYLLLDSHIVACVAVLRRYSRASAAFEVECTGVVSKWLRNEGQFRLNLSWSKATARQSDRIRKTLQRKPLVELAATAVAFVIAHRVLRLRELDVSGYGERVDYRSVQERLVLEVSGTELPNELERRHRQKVRQALRNPMGWEAYVIVCAFAAEEHRVRVSHHPIATNQR
jgi:hypothetical protein